MGKAASFAGLIVSMLLRGFLGYVAGALIGLFVLAPVFISPPVKSSLFPDTPNLAVIFWSHLFMSSAGLLAGAGHAVRSWFPKRNKESAG